MRQQLCTQRPVEAANQIEDPNERRRVLIIVPTFQGSRWLVPKCRAGILPTLVSDSSYPKQRSVDEKWIAFIYESNNYFLNEFTWLPSVAIPWKEEFSSAIGVTWIGQRFWKAEFHDWPLCEVCELGNFSEGNHPNTCPLSVRTSRNLWAASTCAILRPMNEYKCVKNQSWMTRWKINYSF
jgi:hypothetical protein